MGFRLRDDFEIRRDNANNRTVVENLNTGNTFILNDDGSFDATQVNGQIGDSSNRSDVYGDSVDASSVSTDDIAINNIAAKGASTSTQDIPNNTVTQVELDSADLADNGFKDDANTVDVDTANNKLVLQKNGKYTLTLGFKYSESLNDGTRVLGQITAGGVRVASHDEPIGSSVTAGTTISGLVKVTSAPVDVTADVLHDHGSARLLENDQRVFLSGVYEG